MPPKRKGAATKGRGGKKAKTTKEATPEPVPTTSNPIKDSMAKLKRGNTIKKQATPDSSCPLFGASVHEDYDCMLNQTNVGHNNNKFYIVQVLKSGLQYYAWNRWGRVGETGQNALKGPIPLEAAIKDFQKKFSDKTKNKWDNRVNFKPCAGKYTLIEVESTDDTDVREAAAKLEGLDDMDAPPKKFAPCNLDKPTQSLVKLIFDNDMFKEAMADFNIDVKKMPLGKLSKQQIAKGFDVLVDIENALKKKKTKANMTELTSQFFTLIPHAFGRQRPPLIDNEELVQQKKDMLLVLADIELAQAMQKDDSSKKKGKGKGKGDADNLEPDPMDTQYDLLNCDLEVLNKTSEEFKIIKTYLENTKSRNLQVMEVWKVNRQGEDDRFMAHDSLGNRKLLWHGTNMAVVAAILKSGLRIMPHSGGRVGRGIYFASENGKSAAYVRASRNIGIMFLNEVVLGKEKHIKQNDCGLIAAPKGFDSVVAVGQTEPDPKQDTTLEMDGNEVTVPRGKPIQTEHQDSHFYQSEYLVYKESQNRIRYLLKLKF